MILPGNTSSMQPYVYCTIDRLLNANFLLFLSNVCVAKEATQATSLPDSSRVTPARSHPFLSQSTRLLSVHRTREEPVMMLQALYSTPYALFSIETT